MKKEYGKLHDRYSELFKTHLDYMERTKAVLGPERLDAMQQGGGAYASMRPKIAGMALNQLNRSSGPVSFGYSELEHNAQSIMSADIGAQTTPSVERPPVSLKSELKVSLQTRPVPTRVAKTVLLMSSRYHRRRQPSPKVRMMRKASPLLHHKFLLPLPPAMKQMQNLMKFQSLLPLAPAAPKSPSQQAQIKNKTWQPPN